MPNTSAPNAVPMTEPWPPKSRQPPTVAATTNCSSRPSPSFACADPRRRAVSMPTSQAAQDVATNRAILVRPTGMPVAPGRADVASDALNPVAVPRTQQDPRRHQRDHNPPEHRDLKLRAADCDRGAQECVWDCKARGIVQSEDDHVARDPGRYSHVQSLQGKEHRQGDDETRQTGRDDERAVRQADQDGDDERPQHGRPVPTSGSAWPAAPWRSRSCRW